MPVSTEADIVALIERLDSHMGQQTVPVLLADCRLARDALKQLRAERDAAAREEAWIVTQSGLAVSMWLTESAATKVLDSYKRSTKGKGDWAVERVTVIRALPSTVIATSGKDAT